jgi:hypothetical protein
MPMPCLLALGCVALAPRPLVRVVVQARRSVQIRSVLVRIGYIESMPNTHKLVTPPKPIPRCATRNFRFSVNSVVPLLKTSIVIRAECPFSEWPASTFVTPSGVRWPNLPATT